MMFSQYPTTQVYIWESLSSVGKVNLCFTLRFIVTENNDQGPQYTYNNDILSSLNDLNEILITYYSVLGLLQFFLILQLYWQVP